jgi:hypothetical protein
MSERTWIDQQGREVEVCWTGLSVGHCHRGGIGCPLPHPNDPADYRMTDPLDVLDWNPLDYGLAYPELPDEPRARKRARRRVMRELHRGPPSPLSDLRR